MSKDNVVDFPGVTRLDVDPEKILNGAANQLETCVIIGYDKDGEFWFSSSVADGGDVLWLLKLAEQALLSV